MSVNNGLIDPKSVCIIEHLDSKIKKALELIESLLRCFGNDGCRNRSGHKIKIFISDLIHRYKKPTN